jgi:hypothetical protein
MIAGGAPVNLEISNSDRFEGVLTGSPSPENPGGRHLDALQSHKTTRVEAEFPELNLRFDVKWSAAPSVQIHAVIPL